MRFRPAIVANAYACVAGWSKPFLARRREQRVMIVRVQIVGTGIVVSFGLALATSLSLNAPSAVFVPCRRAAERSRS